MYINPKIVLIIAILAVLAVIAYRLDHEKATQQINGTVNEIQQAQLQRQQLQEQKEREQRVQQQARAVQAMERSIARERAVLERQERSFEEAFEKYYVVPEGCDHWESKQQMVECVDHKMNTRMRFREEFFSGDNQVTEKRPVAE